METLTIWAKAIKGFAVKHSWWTAVLLIIILGGGLWYYKNKTKVAEINFAEVKRGTVSQVVSVTGTVKPAHAVDLSFEKSGRVTAVYRDVGERVGAGEKVAVLDGADLSAQLAQARATVKAEQAKLDELKSGARPEDIQISQVAVDNAANEITNDIKSGYVNADDAIRNKIDQFFTNPRSQSPQLTFSAFLSDSQLRNDIETNRPTIEKMLSSWNTSIAALSPEEPYLSEAKNNLRGIQSYLDKVAAAVNSLNPSSSFSQTTIDSYKAAVLTGRTNVTTALDALTTAQDKLRTARSELALKKAGTIPEKLSAQEAAVEGAEANVMNLEAQLAKTAIRSPFSGVVTKMDAKVGEIAPAGTVLVSVISDAGFEIEANIPEADIAKIKIGNAADVTLDAYGSDVLFKAVVTKIDPAETVVEGVATYKTTLQFKDGDGRIKSGMTANTDIYGDKHENILYIPGRTISTKGIVKTVTLVEGTNTRSVEVTAGLRGSNGDVEILSGLKEGDRVKTN